MKAISLREPWASFMVRGIKRIENRTWPTRFRGTVLVHASSWWRASEVQEDYEDAAATAVSLGFGPPRFTPETMKPLRGGIVGAFDVVDCVTESDDPYFWGPYGFVVENPVMFPETVPCRGALGFFDVPDHVAAICAGFLEAAHG